MSHSQSPFTSKIMILIVFYGQQLLFITLNLPVIEQAESFK